MIPGRHAGPSSHEEEQAESQSPCPSPVSNPNENRFRTPRTIDTIFVANIIITTFHRVKNHPRSTVLRGNESREASSFCIGPLILKQTPLISVFTFIATKYCITQLLIASHLQWREHHRTQVEQGPRSVPEGRISSRWIPADSVRSPTGNDWNFDQAPVLIGSLRKVLPADVDPGRHSL